MWIVKRDKTADGSPKTNDGAAEKQNHKKFTTMEDKCKFKFEKLILWQRTMAWGEKIYVFIATLPTREIYNLISANESDHRSSKQFEAE